MPLSDHEQQLLDELEKQLRSEDPRFAKNITSDTKGSLSARRILLGILLAVGGILLALFAISLGTVWSIVLGVVAFGILVAGGMVALTPGREARAAASGAARAAKPGTPKKSGFMDRMEERWERRNGEGR